ncbi:putative pendrin-like [Sesbania bispinosa]|nr:putative pendrin-like [Sesbania bispinosa]
MNIPRTDCLTWVLDAKVILQVDVNGGTGGLRSGVILQVGDTVAETQVGNEARVH